MMLATGCRIGECLAISWDEIDVDQAAVDVFWRRAPDRRRAVVVALDQGGKYGERLITLPMWAMTMLTRRRLVIAAEVQPVFPDTLGGWRDPSDVRRVWREVGDQVAMDGLVSHTLRKTVASFLADSDVSARKISDQLGHARVSTTQDRYLGRKLTDRQTADVLEELMGSDETGAEK